MTIENLTFSQIHKLIPCYDEMTDTFHCRKCSLKQDENLCLKNMFEHSFIQELRKLGMLDSFGELTSKALEKLSG